MDAFVATAPARWGISPETSCGPGLAEAPDRGVGDPKAGPT